MTLGDVGKDWFILRKSPVGSPQPLKRKVLICNDEEVVCGENI